METATSRFARRVDSDLELKLVELQDAEGFFRVLDKSRAHIGKWMIWPDDVKSIDDMRRSIDVARKLFEERSRLPAGIWFEGQPVGAISLDHIDLQAKQASVAYWLGRYFEGQGLVSRCCDALLEYAFDDLDLHRIEIRCARENEKSRAVPERLGFKLEGRLRGNIRLRGRYYDEIIYGMLAEEWRQRAALEHKIGTGSD